MMLLEVTRGVTVERRRHFTAILKTILLLFIEVAFNRKGSAFFVALAISVMLNGVAGCDGSDGSGDVDRSSKVTITGVVEDGNAQVVSDASCSFVDRTGATLATDECDQNGIYQLYVPTDEIGYIYCGPKDMPSLNLSTVVSTDGVAAGETLAGENITPTTTVAADIIRSENPTDLNARKRQLMLQAQTDADLQLVAAMAGRLFRAMLANRVNACFGDDRNNNNNGGGDGGDGGRGDTGGVGGDAGDGADFSPLPEARCSFVIGKELSSAEEIYPAALADFLADGKLDRPDLATLAEAVMDGLDTSPEEIREAFDAWFPDGLGESLTAITDENGRYFLPIPAHLSGYVRCIPKDQEKLALATFIPGRLEGEVREDQDVNPATTVFSAVVAPKLDQDLIAVKENFQHDIEGLEVLLDWPEYPQGTLDGFTVQTSPATNSEVGLVAFSATALFNIFYKNGLDADFPAAIADLVANVAKDPDHPVDSAFMEAEGIPADRAQELAAKVNDAIGKAEAALGTELEKALTTARINVTVMTAPDDSGLVQGAEVDVASIIDLEDWQAWGGTTDANGQVTLTIGGISETETTPVTVAITSVPGYEAFSAATLVAAFSTVDLDITLPAEYFTLVILGSGDGQGTVTSAPAGIDCQTTAAGEGDCGAAYADGAQVVLTATPAPGSTFDRWDGVCSDAGATCTVTMDADLTLTAGFSNQCSEDDLHIDSPEASFGTEGGQGGFSVTAPAGCPWSVSTDAPDWITISSGDSGRGNHTVQYAVLANDTPSPRTGTITVGQRLHTVTQGPLSCSVTISPKAQNIPRAGGSGSISVTVPDGCPWTASESVNWIAIDSSASGSGNGTVAYTVKANADSPQRSADILVAGQTHTVTQERGACPYTISPVSENFDKNGGTRTITVTPLYPDCTPSWEAEASAEWIHINSDTSSGQGEGAVEYFISPNAGPALTGTITVAGKTHTVTQEQGTCSYALDPPNNDSFDEEGGTGTITVTPSYAECTTPWEAETSVDWITITSGSSGSGEGTVSYQVLPNEGAGVRDATITVAWQSHTVTQKGAPQPSPPEISNARDSYHGWSDQCANSDGGTFSGHFYNVYFDYKDPNGDADKAHGGYVTVNGARWSWADINGDGFSGTVTLEYCSNYPGELTLTQMDGAGLTSNELSYQLEINE